MNIAIISPYGMSTVIFTKTLTSLLKNEGHTIFTISPYNGYRKEIEEIQSNHFYTEFSLGISPLTDILHIFKIRKFINKNNIDLLLTFTTKPNLFLPLYLLRKNKIYSIIAVRGLGRIFSPKKDNLLSFSKKFFINQLYKFALNKTNCLWCTNNADKNHLKKLSKGNLKTLVTRNSLDLNYYKTSKVLKNKALKIKKSLGLTKNKFVVLLVARLIPQKGINEFMQLSKILLKNYSCKIHFLLIAPEEKNSKISIPAKKIIEHQNNHKNFTWIPFVKDIRPYYEVCSVSILPSYYKEGGHPRAILEAMAFSKPVISSNTPEARGPIKNKYNGFLIDPKNVNEMQSIILKLFEDKKLYKEMGRNSHKRILDRYSDKDQLKKVVSFIGSLG